MDKKTADALKKILARVNENSRQLRILEESLERERESRRVMEDELLKAMQDIKVSLERTIRKLEGLANKLKEMEEKINDLQIELSKKVNKEELKELEEYVELLSPLPKLEEA